MDGNHLSKRLQAVADQVPLNSRLADIGSDHAYLPIYLAQKHLINFAIAGEVVKGPFHNAEYEINKANVTSIVHPRLANGLDVINQDDHVDVITIAGMGGTLIRKILNRGLIKIYGTEKLILQPNIGEYRLREWLVNHNYRISDEKIIEENHKIYEIIVADKISHKTFYTQDELYFGPILLKERSLVLLKKYQAEYSRMQQAIEQMKHAKNDAVKIKIKTTLAQMNLIHKMIGELF